jgi:hypothetical protein
MFANISSSFEDKELELFPLDLEPWLDDEIMKFKGENLFISEIWKVKKSDKCSDLYDFHILIRQSLWV